MCYASIACKKKEDEGKKKELEVDFSEVRMWWLCKGGNGQSIIKTIE